MSNGIKIFLGVMLTLAILSGIFLLTAKKPSSATTVQPSVAKKTSVPAQKVPATPGAPSATVNKQIETPVSKPVVQDQKALVQSQWTQCKNAAMAPTTNLIWSIQILEGIPTGGTYAKGNLENDSAFPVHVIVKSDSQMIEKIKAMLVVGKTAFLRGNCTDVATDGSVVLQAF